MSWRVCGLCGSVGPVPWSWAPVTQPQYVHAQTVRYCMSCTRDRWEAVARLSEWIVGGQWWARTPPTPEMFQ